MKKPSSPFSSPRRDCVAMGIREKSKPILRRFTHRTGDREAAKGSLEWNHLANKFIVLFTIQTSYSTIRTVTHHFQRTAILKLPKLALCPLPAITTQSPRGERGGEGIIISVIEILIILWSLACLREAPPCGTKAGAWNLVIIPYPSEDLG